MNFGDLELVKKESTMCKSAKVESVVQNGKTCHWWGQVGRLPLPTIDDHGLLLCTTCKITKKLVYSWKTKKVAREKWKLSLGWWHFLFWTAYYKITVSIYSKLFRVNNLEKLIFLIKCVRTLSQHLKLIN